MRVPDEGVAVIMRRNHLISRDPIPEHLRSRDDEAHRRRDHRLGAVLALPIGCAARQSDHQEQHSGDAHTNPRNRSQRTVPRFASPSPAAGANRKASAIPISMVTPKAWTANTWLSERSPNERIVLNAARQTASIVMGF